MASNNEKQRESKDYLFVYTPTLDPTKEYSPDEIAKQEEDTAKWVDTSCNITEILHLFPLVEHGSMVKKEVGSDLAVEFDCRRRIHRK